MCHPVIYSCLSDLKNICYFITSILLNNPTHIHTQTGRRGLVRGLINNSGPADEIALQGAFILWLVPCEVVTLWSLQLYLRWTSGRYSPAVFTRGPYTCRLGFPFLRGIFMALHQLCHVSDVRTVCLQGPQIATERIRELVQNYVISMSTVADNLWSYLASRLLWCVHWGRYFPMSLGVLTNCRGGGVLGFHQPPTN